MTAEQWTVLALHEDCPHCEECVNQAVTDAEGIDSALRVTFGHKMVATQNSVHHGAIVRRGQSEQQLRDKVLEYARTRQVYGATGTVSSLRIASDLLSILGEPWDSPSPRPASPVKRAVEHGVSVTAEEYRPYLSPPPTEEEIEDIKKRALGSFVE